MFPKSLLQSVYCLLGIWSLHVIQEDCKASVTGVWFKNVLHGVLPRQVRIMKNK